jgi:hypothetical protein
MKTLARIVFFIVIAVALSATQASALIVAWDVVGHGSPADTTLTASTIDADIANAAALSRVGVAGVATANAYNSNNTWNNTASFIEGNKYVTFTLVAGASDLVLESLDYAVTLSASAPGSLTWGFKVDGGSFTTTTTTPGSAAATSLTTWNFADTTVTAGQTAEFRMWVWGTVSASGGTATSNGTGRIANISGNDLIVNYHVIPEPSTISLIGMGLIGLLAFVRRRHS